MVVHVYAKVCSAKTLHGQLLHLTKKKTMVHTHVNLLSRMCCQPTLDPIYLICLKGIYLIGYIPFEKDARMREIQFISNGKRTIFLLQVIISLIIVSLSLNSVKSVLTIQIYLFRKTVYLQRGFQTEIAVLQFGCKKHYSETIMI